MIGKIKNEKQCKTRKEADKETKIGFNGSYRYSSGFSAVSRYYYIYNQKGGRNNLLWRALLRGYFMKNYDVIIIGSGIVGAFAARELSRYDLHVLVVDRSCDIGEGSTKTNSGILYPGFHPRGGSLKGISCVLGNAMYDAVCAELGVSMKRVGSLFVAFHPEGEKMLEEKYKNGLKNGTRHGIYFRKSKTIEPLLSTAVTKALYTNYRDNITF